MDHVSRAAEQRDAEASNPLGVIPPAQIAQLVENVGVGKTHLTFIQTLTLGILAGAFIAFGAMF